MQFPAKNEKLKDVFNIVLFIGAVLIGAWIINSLIFRSFDVTGPSMEPTLQGGDRLVVNRLPVTWNILRGEEFMPERGQIVVLRNPYYTAGDADEYIVKRVIGLPGERVVISGGKIQIYNDDNPGGFDPYKDVHIENTSVNGTIDKIVPNEEIFVIGDNRAGEFSLDSRNGLGTIPLHSIVGPVSFRIFPFTRITGDL